MNALLLAGLMFSQHVPLRPVARGVPSRRSTSLRRRVSPCDSAVLQIGRGIIWR